VDTEVARTLAELERKLGDLERALSGAVRVEPAGGLASGARLVDERLEELGSAPAPPTPGPSPTPGPAPAQAFAPPPPAPIPVPATASQNSDESIELAELARFRDRLEQTMHNLLADYERVIRLRNVSESRPSADRT
jgi:hypothetical protein